ncbi:unnamed protein product, partial [Urochloa humidicola]
SSPLYAPPFSPPLPSPFHAPLTGSREERRQGDEWRRQGSAADRDKVAASPSPQCRTVSPSPCRDGVAAVGTCGAARGAAAWWDPEATPGPARRRSSLVLAQDLRLEKSIRNGFIFFLEYQVGSHQEHAMRSR